MAWYDGALAPPNSPTDGPWDPGYLAWLRQQQQQYPGLAPGGFGGNPYGPTIPFMAQPPTTVPGFAPPPGVDTSVSYNQQNTPAQLAAFDTTGATGQAAGSTWEDFARGMPGYQDWLAAKSSAAAQEHNAAGGATPSDGTVTTPGGTGPSGDATGPSSGGPTGGDGSAASPSSAALATDKSAAAAGGTRPWYAFAGGGNQQGWGTAGLSNLPQEQQLFYDVNPELVNRAVETYANADPLSHYRQYVQAQMPGWQQDYARQTALPGHAADTYTDYVGQRYNQLAQGFGGLSASQRGENPLAFGGGEGTAPGRIVYR